MCGIFGTVTGKARNSKLISFVKDGFIASQVRGSDSSGMTLVDTIVKGRLAGVQKLPVCGTMFLQDKAADHLIDNVDGIGNMSICHVRAATSGKVTLNNAHPFIVESTDGRAERELVGVHNGTLQGWASHKDGKYFNVDSEWALAQIFEHGIEAFRSTIKGAYCFVWYDSDERKTLNFALNDQRHMFIAFTKNDDMLYASEAGMLYWLAERNDLAIDGEVLQLNPDYHYQFEVGKVREYTKVKLPKPVAAVSSVSTTSTGTTGGYTSGYTGYTTPSTMSKVDLVLGKYLAAPSESPNPFRKEYEAAKALQMNGKKGVFKPVMFINNGTEVQGKLELEEDGKWDGIIRNAMHLDWQAGDEWNVSVIGLRELPDSQLLAICSKPRVTAELPAAANG